MSGISTRFVDPTDSDDDDRAIRIGREYQATVPKAVAYPAASEYVFLWIDLILHGTAQQPALSSPLTTVVSNICAGLGVQTASVFANEFAKQLRLSVLLWAALSNTILMTATA